MIDNERLKQAIVTKDKQIADSKKQVEEYSSYIFKIKELQDEVEISKDKVRQADQLAEKCKMLERKMQNYNQTSKQLSVRCL